MLGNQYQTPASSRAKYAIEALTGPSGGGNPLRKAIMVALMALAGSLFFVLPDGDQELIAVAASDGDGIVVDDAPSNEDDGGVSESTAEAAAAQVAVGTEAAITGMEHNLRNGIAITAAGELMSDAKGAADDLDANGTVPPTSAAVAAPVKIAPSTTAAPTTTAPAAEATAASDEDESTSTSDATSTSEGDSSSTTSAETTTSSTDGDSSSSSSTPDTTTAPDTTVPETTEPTTETTEPETTEPTSAENGWVDTGNGVLVPPVLLQIRFCESTDNYAAANPVSSARGAYQFLTGSWAAYGHKDRYGVSRADLATPAQQDEAALITWQQDGTRPWNASRHCWG